MTSPQHITVVAHLHGSHQHRRLQYTIAVNQIVAISSVHQYKNDTFQYKFQIITNSRELIVEDDNHDRIATKHADCIRLFKEFLQ